MRMQFETLAVATAGNGTNFCSMRRVVGANDVARRNNTLKPTAMPHALEMAPTYLRQKV